MKLSLLLFAALTTAFAGSSDQHKEDFHFTYTLVNGRLDVSGFNGSIEVTGWDTNTIEITGQKYAETPDQLRMVQVESTQEGNLVRVKATRPSGSNNGWNRCNCGARFVIKAPRHTELPGLKSSNGSIKVQDMDGAADIVTSNGAVRLARMRGAKISVRTSNGAIDLQSIEGSVTANTSNGGITVDAVKGSLNASTSNGGIRGRLSDTTTSDPIRLSTSNGPIDVRIDMLRNNDVIASTSNGSLTIRIPEGAGLRISATTSSHESITTDMPIQVRGTLSKHRLEGTVGSGGPLVQLSTSNGQIRIMRQ